jgi:energy-coupling factor transporter ATP-binding protein EcfA2
MSSLIQVKNLTYTYENESEPVLKDVSLTIDQGEFVLIVGPSGSGKSTLCQVFNGIIPNVLGGDVQGEVIVDGKAVFDVEVKDMSTSLGIVFQDPDAQLCNIYVEDEIAFSAENLKVDPVEIRQRIKDTLDRVGLSGFEQRKVFELSGGQKQKVGIASVLSMKPKILILDNATANLDPQATKDVFDLLKALHEEHGHTIIVVENKIDDIIHLVDRIIVMDAGKIVSDGPPRQIISQSGKELMEMGVWIPEISELALRLQDEGFTFDQFPISVHDAYLEMKDRWNKSYHMITYPSRNEMKEDIIVVKNLSYMYPNGTKALNNVSFSIKKGDFVAILGTNGSGKTTLVKHLMGIIKPPKGKVFLKGEDISKRTLLEMTEDVSYVFQNPEHQFVTENVLEECIYSLKVKHGINKNQEVSEEILEKGIHSLKQINLYEARDKNPFMLSGGEKRRLSVVASIAMGQDIIILDEPTTGQDYASATKLLELCYELNRNGKTVIMINHDIRLVCRWVNTALVMHQGNLIFNGDVHDLFLNEDVCRKASLIEPPISQLAKKLSAGDLKRGILTIEQFIHPDGGVREAAWA